MIKADIEKKIKIIIDNSSIEPSENYAVSKNKQRYIFGQEDVLIEEYPEDFDFISKHVQLLRKFYTQSSINDKKIFEKILIKRVTYGNVIAFNTLIHLNLFSEAFKIIKKKYNSYVNSERIAQLSVLAEIIKYEWNIFKLSQIEDIYKWINDVYDRKNKLGKNSYGLSRTYKAHMLVWSVILKRANAVLIKDIDWKLNNGIDLEIKGDQEVLKKELKKYGFASDLEETLDKVDQKLFEATDNFDYKNCMDLIRGFTERLYEMIAKTISPEKGNKVDPKDSKEVAKFFIEQGLISDEQGRLLADLRHFLSNLGSHRLKSKIEDARLSRNMTIEFSLYLIKKLESRT